MKQVRQYKEIHTKPQRYAKAATEPTERNCGNCWHGVKSKKLFTETFFHAVIIEVVNLEGHD